MSGRLVVVSNRIADPRKPAAGGLAVAVGEALNRTGGLWFGWSGNIVEGGTPGEGALRVEQAGKVELATVDLSREDHDAFYLGYSNNVLWPVFHYRLDLARFDAGYFPGYRRANRLFARELAKLLQPDDVVWVHDYHLMPLAHELRQLGCRQRMGFFLHIPLPPPQILAAIPEHEWLMRTLFAYDLAGFQSEADMTHFSRYVESEARARVLDAHHFTLDGRTLRAQAFPIGIDVDEFEELAEAREARQVAGVMRQQYATRQLLIGIDRLDYSKGIPHRVRAFRELLAQHEDMRNLATLIQIASPSREDLNAYADIRAELDQLCGAINGDYGDFDWMPVRYIRRVVARKRVPGLYRAARVGLVTPLRDGMNLVAKEFVVAQEYNDPGVLVLSRFAGAAEQLQEALLVNPYDAHGTAETIYRALQMPLGERRERHQALLGRIKEHDVHWWRQTFLDALDETAQSATRARAA